MVRNHQGGYPYLNLSLFLLKIYRELNVFLVKLIGHWIPSNKGQGITRDILKNPFYFQHSTTNRSKVGEIFKTEMLDWVLRNLEQFFVVENFQRFSTLYKKWKEGWDNFQNQNAGMGPMKFVKYFFFWKFSEI